MLSEKLWELFRRATFHAYGVLLLIEDNEVAREIFLIFASLAKQRKLFEDLAITPRSGLLLRELSNGFIRYGLLNLGVKVTRADRTLSTPPMRIPPAVRQRTEIGEDARGDRLCWHTRLLCPSVTSLASSPLA